MNLTAQLSSLALIVLGLSTISLRAQPLAPSSDTESAPGSGPTTGSDACAGGVIPDDGSAETGYGWVPSVLEGEYVQHFRGGQLANRRLETVCVCWLRTHPDSDIDFEVVFYQNVDGEPAATPYAAVSSSAEVTAMGIVASFFEVDVSGVTIPVGPSYIGARWDASADQFFFICTDTSDETEPVEVFFRDDRSPDGIWTSVFETIDPIFDEHKAIMIRATSGPPVTDIPALAVAGLAVLALALAGVALVAMRRGGSSESPSGSQ